jgi:hypothetical protein
MCRVEVFVTSLIRRATAGHAVFVGTTGENEWPAGCPYASHERGGQASRPAPGEPREPRERGGQASRPAPGEPREPRERGGQASRPAPGW